MKIILLGATGNLGHKVYRELYNNKHQVIPVLRKEFDFSYHSKEQAQKAIVGWKLQKGDYIINCAGIIPQKDKSNYHQNLINTSIPQALAEKAGTGYNLIQISTDCVFSGNKGQYVESDTPDPVSSYGFSKLKGERPSKSMVIRTSFIGQERTKDKFGLLDWFLHNTKDNPVGYINNYWNGLTTFELSRIIERIISRGLFMQGIFHIYSPHYMSKYELLNIINKEFKTNKNVVASSCQRSIDRTLLTENQWFLDNFQIPPIYDQIKELAKKYETTNDKSLLCTLQ